jgi:hypothetical protein
MTLEQELIEWYKGDVQTCLQDVLLLVFTDADYLDVCCNFIAITRKIKQREPYETLFMEIIKRHIPEALTSPKKIIRTIAEEIVKKDQSLPNLCSKDMIIKTF